MQNEIPSFVLEHRNDREANMFDMIWDIRLLLKAGKIDLDLNGHFLSKSSKYSAYAINSDDLNEVSRRLDTIMYSSSPENARISPQRLIEVAKAAFNGSTAEPIEFAGSNLYLCGECGEALRFSFDGRTLRAINECEQPNGALPYSFKITVASGRLCFANDLRDAYPDAEYLYNEAPDGKTRDINTRVGAKNVTLDYAARNMAHIFVGNSSPGMYLQESGQYIVAERGYDDETDQEIEPEGKELGSIITDLWWYSMVDAVELENRFLLHVKDQGTFAEWMKKEDVQVIDIEPGTYKIYVLPPEGREWNKPIVYSTMERVY